MNKIAIFYHIGQLNHWREVYNDQINLLHQSGLYEVADFIYCGINGDEKLPEPVPSKLIVNYNRDKVLEANTLEAMWNFARINPDFRILYIHTKGVTRIDALKEVADKWRKYMEYFVVSQWKRCIDELQNYDTVGVQLRDKATYWPDGKKIVIDANYYDGNFWWVNASYIKTLDTKYLYTNDTPWLRGKSELWIGSGSSPKMQNLFTIPGNSPYYDCNYDRDVYKMSKKNCKIVMICMFKNEAPVLRRMLNSCLPYVDYYVMQDNGSTDGSDQIAKDFLTENNLSGEIYVCEEGWKGFGWNRDHLIKYCQQTNHGCDWILKMDCDEILQIDNDFDWSLLDNKSIHAFHIPAVSGSTIYYRAWMWNANMKWAFNHDPCHETIYCQDPNIGENFQRVDLPRSIRQIGLNEGQSWSNPTKFVTDSLVLEEKLISEGKMLEDDNLYHFWYIGKSYFDAHTCRTFPLGHNHGREYARRSIWYFSEWIKHYFKNRSIGFNESAYNALIFSAEARRFLGEWDEAITTYKQAEIFAPIRNDHLIGLAECYRHTGDYKKMLEVSLTLLNPSRKNPFPHSASFINDEHYYDTGTLPKRLYDEALQRVENQVLTPKLPFYINQRQTQQRRFFIVDNYYQNPDEIRNFALTQVEYEKDLRWYKGLRSKTVYRPEGMKESFEHIIGEKIHDFESGYNGVFQIMMSDDPQVYHFDTQKWAAMIYLTPNAPLESGTRLHRSKINGTRHRDDPDANYAFQGDFYDSTKFDISDSAANIYNRLVIMDAGCFHSAGPYFGNSPQIGRLTHLFFFC